MLSNIEIGAFLNFYNRSGYVLDFSTASSTLLLCKA